MNDHKDTIKSLAQKFYAYINDVRQHLHQYPELSFEEHMTADFICAQLDKYGIKYTRHWAGHGIVAEIFSKKGLDKTVAIRGDMDALPIQEKNDVPYKSKNNGVMHACGHDVHTSCVLGAAIILNHLKDELPHNVKFIFQPGEEKLPGGASMMIEEGVLKNPVPLSILGQHVYPELKVGQVGIKSGLYMASADEIYIRVKGKGGHAAMPHKCIDPILISAELITTLQTIVSRKAPANIPTVLSIGKINSVGGATNIIPDEVKLEGTLRTMDEVWRMKAHDAIQKIAEGMSLSSGATIEVQIEKGYPCLVNEPQLSDNVRDLMKAYLGDENVVELSHRMTAEDFAFYSQIIPACFYRLGTANASTATQNSVHTPYFDIDSKALEVGMGLMAYLVFHLD